MDKPRLTGMLRIIEAADMKSTSISETYGNVKPILEKIAESLRIAKIDIFFHVRPDEYDMQGLEKHFETVFCPDCEPDEENAVAKVFEDVGNSAAEMKITPCKATSERISAGIAASASASSRWRRLYASKPPAS